jgi:hypothetical protein
MKDKTYDKNKIISAIVRKDYGGHYHSLTIPNKSEVNYEQRTKLAEELSFNKNIDIFGIYWTSNGTNIKGDIWNKHVGLDDYMFSFGLENSIQKNYISEKFWDIILTNGIPLYLGCSNILNYVPKESFIYLNNLNTEEILHKVNFILENYGEIYETNKKNILELKKNFYTDPKYNIWERVKEEIKHA